MNRLLLAALVALVATPALAHDFWMAADKYRLPASGGSVRIDFRIGEADASEPWDLHRYKVVALRSLGPGGRVDQQAAITPAGEAGFATVTLAGPGTHIVEFESNQSPSDLPAAEFNPYVEDEGLTAITQARAAAGTTAKNGRELYSRRAKALIQVGGARSADVSRPIGHTLEIVPLRNPYDLAEGEALPVRVLFRGKPLPGALVHISAIAPTPRNKVAAAHTDAKGEASLNFPKAGAWNLVAVWGDPLPQTDRAEFETIFSSLTFGY